MRQRSDRSVLIGVCGIDGAGKSTLISALREWAPLREASVQKLKPGANYQRLMRDISDPWADPVALFGSHLARSMGWAEVFDFLSYHDRLVRPALQTPGVLLHDRWTPCFAAFCDSVLGLGGMAAPRLRRVTAADLVLYLDVSPEIALDRIRLTRDPNPDEDITVLRAFRAGYEQSLREADYPVVRIGELPAEQVVQVARDSVAQIVGERLEYVVGG